MFPVFFGRNRPSSQPCWRTTEGSAGSRAPLMQSCVVHVTQASASRTRTSRGETVEATKLNWPSGQTHLQNEASLNTESTARAVAK